MRPTPRMSVLLPLQDERGTGVECIRAWTSQAADPNSFEIVALAPGENIELERSIRPLLRRHDRWIAEPGADEYQLLNIGAKEGRGEFVFVTEAHCVPERECLAAALEELDRSGGPGIRGVSVPEAEGELGALERDAFEDALRLEEDPEHWRKVLIHSFAIRRDLYLAAGGLPPEFGDFSPWVLGIALRQRGHRLRFSPRPRVHHTYDGDLDHLGAHVRSFGRGEYLYRSEHPPELAEAYLEWMTEWEERLQHTRAGALRALRAGLALRHRGTLAAVAGHGAVALLGPRAPITAARWGGRREARRTQQAQDAQSRSRSFMEFWRLRSRQGRLEGLAASRNGGPEIPIEERVDLTQSLAGRAIGFWDPEFPGDGPPFRWTAPLALLRVAVPDQGRMQARLELRPFRRGLWSAHPRVAVDNRIVEATASDIAIEFEIDPGRHWLAFGCSPLRPRRHGSDDSRSLGLAVRSLSFEPAGSGGGR